MRGNSIPQQKWMLQSEEALAYLERCNFFLLNKEEIGVALEDAGIDLFIYGALFFNDVGNTQFLAFYEDSSRQAAQRTIQLSVSDCWGETQVLETLLFPVDTRKLGKELDWSEHESYIRVEHGRYLESLHAKVHGREFESFRTLEESLRMPLRLTASTVLRIYGITCPNSFDYKRIESDEAFSEPFEPKYEEDYEAWVFLEETLFVPLERAEALRAGRARERAERAAMREKYKGVSKEGLKQKLLEKLQTAKEQRKIQEELLKKGQLKEELTEIIDTLLD